jgi:hypothetical protein
MGESNPVPPHAELLWRCVAVYGQEEVHTSLEGVLAESRIDWPSCVRMSIRHGLASILAQHLRAFADDPRVPEEIAACFERMIYANGRRNQALLHALEPLLRGLGRADIPCMVLKGIGLALSIYPDPALRNCADIDLLVHPADLNRAGAIAQELGFAPMHAEADDCVLHRTYIACCEEDILSETLPLEYEAEELRAKVGPHRHRVVVEIHRGLFRDGAGMMRRSDDAPLWRHPRYACLPGGTWVQTPSCEVMLVHLAAHAADHGFGRLIYFHDIAMVIRDGGPSLDWDLVLDLSRRYEVCGYAWRCLEFVARECGAAVPAPVLRALRRIAGGRIRPLQLTEIVAAEREVGTGITLQRLLLEPDARRFCASLRKILFPPPVVMRRLYGAKSPPVIALLYLARPFLLTAHLARLMGRRRQQKS